MSSLALGRAKPRKPAKGKGKRRRSKAATFPAEYNMLLTATLCLLALGAVMVFSASSTTKVLSDGGLGESTYYLKRTLIVGAIGLLIMHFTARHGLQVVRRLTPALLATSFFLLLAVLVVGTPVNGASRWIDAGSFQLQPSELAKIALILYGVDLLASKPKRARSIQGFMPFLVVAGFAALLVALEPDLGTALVIAFSVCATLVAAGARLRELAMIAFVLGFLALALTVVEPYRMARLTGFLNPGADASGAGFQAAQAKIALGSGGIFGVGIGNGVQKAYYLPEAHTDMISAVIGEELGMVGIFGVVGLFSVFGYAGLQAAKKAKDSYAKLLAAGLTSLVLIQAAINLFAVMGLAPLTGVPLPFVSYGNSSLLATLFAVGLILNVARGGPPALANCASSRAADRAAAKGAERAVPRAARVVVAAGGTAGHVVPAMAVAAELRASGAEVSFLGTRERIEAELAPQAGYPIDFIKARGIDRRNPLRAAAAAIEALAAVGAARRALRRRGADVVMGGGGFVSGPAGLAAVITGTRLVLTEADSHLGLANRLLAGRARRVCLAFPIAGREGGRYLVTGRPIPSAVLEADRGAARRRFGVAERDRCLLVIGGSQGARSINRCAIEALAERGGRDFDVVHVAGRRDFEELEGRLAAASHADRYTLLAYEPDLGDCLAACDLVLGRSGGSIFEVMAAGRPAILVPYPHATAGHQRANAAWMAEAGAAVVLDEEEMNATRLAAETAALLGDEGRLATMAKASASLARPDAARRIADEILINAAGRK